MNNLNNCAMFRIALLFNFFLSVTETDKKVLSNCAIRIFDRELTLLTYQRDTSNCAQ